MDELKSCPYCGGEPFCGRWLFDGWKIFCRGCYRETRYYENREEAVEEWNKMENE